MGAWWQIAAETRRWSTPSNPPHAAADSAQEECRSGSPSCTATVIKPEEKVKKNI